MTKIPETTGTKASRSSSEVLCANLISGLHAASQPLTILRASLGASEISRHSAEDLPKLLRQSSREVERLCVLFNYLQQFVIVESVKAEPRIENLPDLLSHTLEGVDVLFAEAGVALTFPPAEEPTPKVLVDSSRLEQALSGILLVVLGKARRGDEVVMRTGNDGAFVEVRIESALIPTGAMDAETRLRLALATANLRSQDANLRSTEEPISFTISLPVA